MSDVEEQIRPRIKLNPIAEAITGAKSQSMVLGEVL